MRHPPTDDSRCSLRFQQEQDVLRVWVEGVVESSQQARIAYWKEIVTEARRLDCRRLLVVDRKKGRTATPLELTQMAVHFRAEASHFDAIAVVESDPDFVPQLEHGEIVARMIGINLRIFADKRSAEHWLNYGWKEPD